MATSVATQRSFTSTGPVLKVDANTARVSKLIPTSPDQPDASQVATARLDIVAGGAKRLAAVCTNCAPGSPQDQVFHDLVADFRVGAKSVFRGPLYQLDRVIPRGAVLKVWLGDWGREQAQNVTARWTFTTPDETTVSMH